MFLNKSIISVVAAIAAACIIQPANAQYPSPTTGAHIYQQLQKLNVLGSVLYLAAHPDDENTRLLAYLANGKLYRTGYLSLTRGDGGQNLIGNEQGVELGLIRTQELLAARRIDGAEQFFSRAYDFGFSKSADETMKFWDRNKILSDVVFMIRKFQPDVIITRFPADERAGHGHHTASAILANEAFAAAADPQKYPEHFALGVQPWQARRILWNTFNFGGNNTITSDQFKIEVGGYNPLLGKSYGEIASESRSQHKSQGFGVARQRGQAYEFFETTGGDRPTNDLMEGVNTTWSRIKDGSAITEAIQDTIQAITNRFRFDQPKAAVPALVKLYQQIQLLPAGYWRNKKLQEVQNIIEACSGLFTEAISAQEFGVQGDTIPVSFVLNNRNGVNARLQSVSLLTSGNMMLEMRTQFKPNPGQAAVFNLNIQPPLKDSLINKQLPTNENVVVPFSLPVSDNSAVSQPFWLTNGIQHGIFDINDPVHTGRADAMPAFTARYKVVIEGQAFTIERPLQYKHTDPVKGELYQPLAILPKVIVSIAPTIVLSNVKPATNPTLRVGYTSNVDARQVPASLTFQNGSATDAFKGVPLDLSKGSSYTFSYRLKDAFYQGQGKHLEATLALNFNGQEALYSQYHRSIAYDHIPTIHYFYRDNVRVIDDEIKTVGKKIGYIPGAGDKVADDLQLMGYEVTQLTQADLTEANLRRFDAIITGVRAYNVFEYLTGKYSVLMKYIEEGGNLIVQYNTNNQIGPVKSLMSPYPFTITRSRVTDETAPVTFLLPDHPVLNFPNKITTKDFEGWIQERSTYHAEGFDHHFAAPLAMGDPGEVQHSGSLIIAQHGKGNFVYTGLGFFRQLPSGVGGAYRLMANLIALPDNTPNNTANHQASK